MEIKNNSFQSTINAQAANTVLELTVRNHPGVMSHICGLFSRRAFNMDGILCMPVGNDGNRSRIWIRVNAGPCLNQVEKQVAKLVDVINIRRHAADHKVFEQLEDFFQV